MSCTPVFEWHAWFMADQKKARQVKIKVKSMLIFNLFDIKGIVRKEFLTAGPTVNLHNTVIFYDYCLRMCEGFAPNSGNKRTGSHHLTLPFSPWKKPKATCLSSPTHPTLPCFPV
jgi:hypothetical protein